MVVHLLAAAALWPAKKYTKKNLNRHYKKNLGLNQKSRYLSFHSGPTFGKKYTISSQRLKLLHGGKEKVNL